MSNARFCAFCGAELKKGDSTCLRCQLSHGLDTSGKDVAGKGLLDGLGIPEDADPQNFIPGTMIGRYKLLKIIGEGGFGVVWMAEQGEPIKRRVALKILKLGMDTRQVVARFEGERQALAMMDHPNITKVLDAGATKTGRPYFVMDLVQGQPITEFCNELKFSPRQRLDLFLNVCSAVQHAHQKSIIHRDLKPSNILVAVQEDKPVPKVIDFGIAKAVQGQLTEKTMVTFLDQIMGTLGYMSPEQAGMKELDVDTRTDIYSLGVLLYELLTGKTPFGTKELVAKGLVEARRIICEQEPLSPSTALTKMDAGERSIVAVDRQCEPTKLVGLIRGELDCIVLKTLEKDRTRRYETASGLALDVSLHLAGEPILSPPPDPLYRFKKFAWKHRRALSVALLFLSLLIVAAMMANKARLVAEAGLYEADMSLAVQALEVDNLGYARQLLELHRNDPLQWRGFEYRYAWLQCRGDAAIELFDGHRDTVRSLIFPTNSSVLASYSVDGTATVWDYRNRAKRFQLTNSWGAVGFSSDGRDVFVADRRNRASFYDVQTGRRKMETWPLDGRLIGLVADGQTLVTTATDYAARLWDLATKEPKMTIPGIGYWDTRGHSEVLSTTASKDGRRVAVLHDVSPGEETRRITIWETEPMNLLSVLTQERRDIHHWQFSPDGTVLAVAGLHGEVWLWEVINANKRVLPASSATIRVTEFSPDGQWLATAGSDQVIRLWNAKTYEPFRSFRGHADRVDSLAFSADGKLLASGSRDGSVYIWKVEPSSSRSFPLGGEKLLERQGVVFSSDGKLLAAHVGEHALGIWEVATLRQIQNLPWGGTPLGFSTNGTSLFVASAGQVDTVDIGLGARTELLRADEGADLRKSVLAHNARRLAWPDPKGSLCLLDYSTGQRLLSVQSATPYDLTRFLFSPRGDLLVAAYPNQIRCWAAGTGRELSPFPGHGPHETIHGLAFSNDGQKLASGGGDYVIKVWDVPTRKLIVDLKGHRQPVYSVAFSPDGKNLASGSTDGTVKLWHLGLNRQLASFDFVEKNAKDKDRKVAWVGFSPDNKTLAALSYDGRTVRVWRAASWDEIRAADRGQLIEL